MEKLKKIDYMMLFKIVYLLDVLFAFNCFVFDLKIMKVLSGFVILFGIILIVSKLKNTKEIMHYRYMWIFLLFMISYIISVIINYPYGIVGNIKGGIWFGLQIILLYYISLKEPAKKIIKEMKIIFGMLIVYITICNLIGIIMMFLQYGGRRFWQAVLLHCTVLYGEDYGDVIQILIMELLLQQLQWYIRYIC